MYDVIIIGGGCAGLTAGIYASRAGLKVLLFADDYNSKGGLLMKTSIVENYPGFDDGIYGSELMSRMENQAMKFGTEIRNEKVLKITNNENFKVETEDSEEFSKTLIIATGSIPNKLNLQTEDKFWSKGISSCAVCDGALYKDKKIFVVGGGDSAMEEALFLTRFSFVTLLMRSNKFRASKIMVERVLANPKIQVKYNLEIREFHGTDCLESIECNDGKIYPADAVFYGLGLKPNTALVENLVELDDLKYIKVFNSTKSSLKGLFVAGDVAANEYRQAIVCAGDGCKAAMDVEKYLNESK